MEHLFDPAISPMYILCNANIETQNHPLFDCPTAGQLREDNSGD